MVDLFTFSMSIMFNKKYILWNIDIFRHILTGGSDGDIRIWKGVDDDDAISHRCGDKTFAVAIHVMLLFILSPYLFIINVIVNVCTSHHCNLVSIKDNQ